MNEQDDLQIENKSLAHSPVKRTKTIVAQSARPPMCRRHACKASHSHPPQPPSSWPGLVGDDLCELDADDGIWYVRAMRQHV